MQIVKNWLAAKIMIIKMWWWFQHHNIADLERALFFRGHRPQIEGDTHIYHIGGGQIRIAFSEKHCDISILPRRT